MVSDNQRDSFLSSIPTTYSIDLVVALSSLELLADKLRREIEIISAVQTTETMSAVLTLCATGLVSNE